jgi:Fe-S-cluster containining protein
MPPLRLAILGESPCHLCTANCCKQNGHEYAVLLEGEERRKFAAFAADVLNRFPGGSRYERVIPYRHARCPFLADNDRCSIYDDRPQNCRGFQCINGYHFGGGHLTTHSEFLQRNPDAACVFTMWSHWTKPCAFRFLTNVRYYCNTRLRLQLSQVCAFGVRTVRMVTWLAPCRALPAPASVPA